MPYHGRYFWGPIRGRYPVNVNLDVIGEESVVVVTACEYRRHRPQELVGFHVPSMTNQPRFVGAATIYVSNVAPHGPPTDPNRGVTFVINVDWDSPLPVATDITVFDDAPSLNFLPDAVRSQLW